MATPAQRRLQASLAAHTRWSRVTDRTQATEPARRGLEAKFAREVDPEGVLPADERAKRVASARKAHYRRMALRSSQVRALRKQAEGRDGGPGAGTAEERAGRAAARRAPPLRQDQIDALVQLWASG